MSERRTDGRLAQKGGMSEKIQANTGSAGALARYGREARNSYRVKRFEIERAAHARAGEGARAPSINLLRLQTDPKLMSRARMFRGGSIVWAHSSRIKV